mmetsp:Transcript_59109/g.151980  ORF Transcript_59109/g.151980 Transcript_59109/m.151980 type:complete len:711 (-) Transcript_59109:70-2202(-)
MSLSDSDESSSLDDSELEEPLAELPKDSAVDSSDDLKDEELPVGKFASLQVRQALDKPPEERSQREVEQICAIVSAMPDPFIQSMEASVLNAVCKVLIVEDFQVGERVFDYEDAGDKVYLVWKGRVMIEKPKERRMPGVDKPAFVKIAEYTHGKAFGELALLRPEGKRPERVTALDVTRCFTLTSKDYHWCSGFSQENFVRDRVAFLRSAERASLEDIGEVDLQAMALHLQEQHYMGEQVIALQGSEVDRVIFVKGGFCKVVRELHPKWNGMIDTYGEKGPPPPNPFAPQTDDTSNVVTVETLSAELGLKSRNDLRQLLQRQQAMEEGSPSSRKDERDSSTPRGRGRGQRTGRKLVAEALPDIPATARNAGARGQVRDESSAGGVVQETVIVDLLQAGRTFGAMEMFEGITYQCSLVAHPWAQVYVISKYDLIRNTSKAILHRIFCDYKMRLSDDRLMQRLKQKNRWNSYKRDLLDDIRSRKNRNTVSIIDRRAPAPRRAGAGVLTEDDWRRVGNGGQLWSGRAQTPPMPNYVSKSGVQNVFDAHSVHNPDGSIDVVVTQERRDASLAALDEKILLTITTAKLRDRYRKQQLVGQHDRSGGEPGNLSGAGQADAGASQQADGTKAEPKGKFIRAMVKAKQMHTLKVMTSRDLDEKARKEAQEYLSNRRIGSKMVSRTSAEPSSESAAPSGPARRLLAASAAGAQIVTPRR